MDFLAPTPSVRQPLFETSDEKLLISKQKFVRKTRTMLPNVPDHLAAFFSCQNISLAASKHLTVISSTNSRLTMRAEIIAYMIYLEGPEYPEYVMHIFLPKVLWDPQIWEFVR